MKKTIGIIAFILLIVIIAGAGISLLRINGAKQQVQLDSQTPSRYPQADQLGSTTSLSILPLYEKSEAADGLVTGHGVSYLIRTDEASILLDAGNNPERTNPSPVIQNMQMLGIELDEIDILVISHNHPDHVGGPQAWNKGSVALDGLQVNQVYLPKALKIAGHTPQTADAPRILAPGVATLGRQPFVELFPFSLIQPLAYEQSLVVNVEGQGLVVITGCGHPTIERIVERAEALFDLPVIGITGGLHYGMSPAAELQPHIDFISLREPALVALSPHDSGPAAIEAFETAFPAAYEHIRVGSEIIFPKNLSSNQVSASHE